MRWWNGYYIGFLGFAVSAAFGPIGIAVYTIGAAVGSDWVCSHAY